MAKSEVYSWRVDPATKMALETEARSQGTTMAEILDRITREWLDAQRKHRAEDEAEQVRLHAVAKKYIGSISGGDPTRSQRVSEIVGRRVKESNAH